MACQSALHHIWTEKGPSVRLLVDEFKTMTYGLYSGWQLPFNALSDALERVDWTEA